jgi:phosphatidylserine decarboxylase
MKQISDISKIIHREGYVFIIVFAIVTFILSSLSSTLGFIGIIMTGWCAYFFRNPERYTPVMDDIVVSAADGVVQSITEAVPPTELGLGSGEMLRISVFLNVFNVHVNRIPVDGKVVGLHYNPGKFLNASLDKASIYNERQSILIHTTSGVKIACVQIAGLIARRIVCDLEEGEEVQVGSRFGIIRFGSRVDVYLPRKTIPQVCVGQTCVGGETILASLKPSTKVAPPKFEVR